MLRQLVFAILTVTAGTLQAAALVEMKTQEGMTRIYSEGTQARMDVGNGSYMLIDSKASTLFVIMPDKQRAMDMSHLLNNPPARTREDITDLNLEKQGNGPRVAGYSTERYRYTAGGKSCGDLLSSREALDDSGLQQAFDTLQRLSAHADAIMQQFARRDDPCQQVGNSFATRIREVGIPMRVTLADGTLLSEIVRLETNASLPANAFDVPAGYTRINAGAMVDQAQRQLRRLQESGQIPPHLLEQIRELQRRQQP